MVTGPLAAVSSSGTRLDPKQPVTFSGMAQVLFQQPYNPIGSTVEDYRQPAGPLQLEEPTFGSPHSLFSQPHTKCVIPIRDRQLIHGMGMLGGFRLRWLAVVVADWRKLDVVALAFWPKSEFTLHLFWTTPKFWHPCINVNNTLLKEHSRPRVRAHISFLFGFMPSVCAMLSHAPTSYTRLKYNSIWDNLCENKALW